MMIKPITKRREQLLTCIPDVLDYESLLYIGASNRRQQELKLFIEKKYNYIILEVWKLNVEWLKKRFKNVIEGDVRKIDKLELGLFDVIMWWHGPEHIREDKIVPVLNKLKNMTKKILITACPWGIYESNPQERNPHESHLSYLYPEFFEKLGWETNTIREKDMKGSNLLAWWRAKHSIRDNIPFGKNHD